MRVGEDAHPHRASASGTVDRHDACADFVQVKRRARLIRGGKAAREGEARIVETRAQGAGTGEIGHQTAASDGTRHDVHTVDVHSAIAAHGNL